MTPNFFSQSTFMSVDIDNVQEVYKNIIQYVKNMNILDYATKHIRLIIANKSRFYIFISLFFYFCGRGNILDIAVIKNGCPKIITRV